MTKLFSYNEGLPSRFSEIVFEDFRPAQLKKMWERKLEERQWGVEDLAVTRLAIGRLSRCIGRKGFGNARAVRTLFEQAVQAAATRGVSTPPKLSLSDIVGPAPTRANIPDLDAALAELERLDALAEVKACIMQVVELVQANHAREMRGEKPLEVPLNRVFLGNPGTGKTTSARIWGRVPKALGLLRKGGVVEKTGSDFIKGFLGQSQEETKQILNSAQGKVLLIDEAYVLGRDGNGGNANAFGQQVLDTIVEKVQGGPGEDISVVMCGYTDEMKEMFRKANPGLARRFNISQPVVFADYDDNALRRILRKRSLKDGLRLEGGVEERALQWLSRKRAQGRFGNAGEVGNLLGQAKLRVVRRLGATASGSGPLELTVEDVLPEADVAASQEDPFAALDTTGSDSETESKFRRSLRASPTFSPISRGEGKTRPARWATSCSSATPALARPPLPVPWRRCCIGSE
uniref:AAA+ ATPase domain-containing protein n=1 Tax=Chromera velia CCMP2878 TaxID=1169474 RepID=A0A0G4I2L6_9ALVE|eukprot:Cvel_10449.t1-p1 / transcript=Cvel_10449.t1 / gene=Cvel_10449 / organism=Chromera_velia_CCMP2878 / gene_product=Protein CbbX, putative / transcript_product=Protein CbbX, putative / location=Cvel_scaffold629:44361-45743(-) / protein_length=461 / sequence_SO=supercontig / SO=protein_coding / is_pseudo=false